MSTRHPPLRDHIWRRYYCECGKRWSTAEMRHEPEAGVTTHQVR
jgi:hypothetical protein